MSMSSYPQRSRRMARLLALPLLVLILASACDNDSTGPNGDVNNHDFEASESFRFAVAVDSRTMLSLEGVTGSVEIDGHAELDSVVVSGYRRVRSETMTDAEAHLDDLRVVVASSASRVDVTTEQPSDTHGRQYVVDYVILAPSSWELSASNVTGAINVGDWINDVDLRCTTGQVTVNGCIGDLDVDVTTGDVSLAGIHGNLDVDTVTGNVAAEVTLPEGGDCDIGLVTGTITLRIPQSTSAMFSARVVTGLISVTDLTLDNASIGSTLVTGILGGGNGNIDLDVTTGSINVDGF